MNKDFADKVALVAGRASDIGAAIAHQRGAHGGCKNDNTSSPLAVLR